LSLASARRSRRLRPMPVAKTTSRAIRAIAPDIDEGPLYCLPTRRRRRGMRMSSMNTPAHCHEGKEVT
jgi:hypothetical protein